MTTPTPQEITRLIDEMVGDPLDEHDHVIIFTSEKRVANTLESYGDQCRREGYEEGKKVRVVEVERPPFLFDG